MEIDWDYILEYPIVVTGSTGEIVFEMRYDLVGQKIWMDDPDMGQWDYGLLQRVLGDSRYVTEIQYNCRRQPVCYRYDSYSMVCR